MTINTTIVVEETIYKSQKNIRFENVNIRKSFPMEIGSVTNTTSVLQFSDSVTLPALTFLHIHANVAVDVALTKGAITQVITTKLLTLSDTIDSVTVTNNASDDASVYMLYGS